jgi:peroxiredoxin
MSAPRGAQPGSELEAGSAKRSGVALIAGVVGLALLFAIVSRSKFDSPVQPGARAPAFSLPRIGGGEPVSLAGHAGRVVLLNFWATWCKPCEDEMPAMERLYRALKGEGFELIAISEDESEDVVVAFRDRLALSFPMALDANKQVSGDYQTYRFPETLLIDRDGTIVERYVGPKDWDNPAYQERLRRLIAGSAVP